MKSAPVCPKRRKIARSLGGDRMLIKNCNDESSLYQLCGSLNNDHIEFNGRAFINNLTGQKYELKELTKKIIHVFDVNFKDSKSLKKVQELSSLIFELESIASRLTKSERVFKKAFYGNSPLAELMQNCRGAIRRDPTAMQKIKENYNVLAKEINSTPDIEAKKDSLKRLSFLNQFLGFRWSRAQSAGRAPLPLVNAGSIFKAPFLSDLQLESCTSLADLYELLNAIREETTIIQHGKEIQVMESRGKELTVVDELSTDKIKRKLLKVFKEEIEAKPYVKEEVYIQFAAAVFLFEKIAPGKALSRNKEIRKALHVCIEGVKQDPSSFNRIMREYNTLAESVNRAIFHAIAYERADSGRMSRNILPATRSEFMKEMELIEFLSLFTDFKLSGDQLNGRGIFPIAYIAKNDSENTAMQFPYNFMGIILNYEIEVKKNFDRLQELQKQIDPKNLAQLFLDQKEIIKIKEEIERLNTYAEVNSKPLPTQLINQMRKELCRLAEVLGIELTIGQKNGTEPIPLYGRELVFAENQHEQYAAAFPIRIARYNKTAHLINLQLDYKKLAIERQRILNHIRKIDAYKLFDDDEPFDKLEQLEMDLENFENSSIGFISGERLRLQKLADLLIGVERYSLLDLTEEQKEGKDYLPLIEIESLPFPGKEVLRMEQKKVSQEKWEEAVKAWPDSWKGIWGEQVNPS